MPHKIGEHFDSYGIKETWWLDGENVTVQRSDDAQAAIDLVSAMNQEGVHTEDGLGRPIAEVPLIDAAAWALERGILPEKMFFTNEHDDAFRQYIREHKKLQYRAASKLFALS